MIVDSEIALHGVRMRLFGALLASVITLSSVIYAVASAMNTFGATFALAVGLCSFGAAVALLLSARQEEKVHAFAARMDRAVSSEGARREEDGMTMRALPGAEALHPLLARDDRHARVRVYRSGQERPHGPGQQERRCASVDHTDGAI